MAWSLARSGNVTWAELVLPVAVMARRVVISKELAIYIGYVANDVLSGKYKDLSHLLLNADGSLKGEGDVIERPQLAQTLENVSCISRL